VRVEHFSSDAEGVGVFLRISLLILSFYFIFLLTEGQVFSSTLLVFSQPERRVVLFTLDELDLEQRIVSLVSEQHAHSLKAKEVSQQLITYSNEIRVRPLSSHVAGNTNCRHYFLLQALHSLI